MAAKRKTKKRAPAPKSELRHYFGETVSFVAMAAVSPPINERSFTRIIGRAGIESGVLTLDRRQGGKLVYARAA